jgi:hypothetical protein
VIIGKASARKDNVGGVGFSVKEEASAVFFMRNGIGDLLVGLVDSHLRLS